MSELQKQVKESFRKRGAATITFGVLLPIAVIIDILTIGFFLTLFDLIALGTSYHSWRAAHLIQKLIDKKKIIFSQNRELEKFYNNIKEYNHKIPTEKEIDELSNEIGYPEMAKTVKKIIRREIRHSHK